ncbi:conserved hypothetical protein [Candidatus Terasakiella magnetica]|uniref:Uncharacterized protein n=1 Tax=Candidatus Terasakiella magnetica TaxID=1867952 RepID=A0A1C3RE38_9PROT|nr:hypothetical protein [Candidatus Terasakiella magnetica]SCA55525.1 conserved hypothetical protein [Candidatus Terasakiella magnetica]
MASTKPGKYIGDAGVAKYLEEYKSQTPFYVVRMRVLGALASPNEDLLPVMVMASFWPEDAFPKFVTKDEAEKFFATFMGLWRRMEKLADAEGTLLSARGKLSDLDEAKEVLLKRLEEIEAGFIEGFWGGQDDMKMPSATAALVDGLSDEATAYHALLQDVEGWSDYSPAMRDALHAEVIERDNVVEDAMKALLLLKEKANETAH